LQQAVCQLEAAGPVRGPEQDKHLKAVLGLATGSWLNLPLKYAEKKSH